MRIVMAIIGGIVAGLVVRHFFPSSHVETVAVSSSADPPHETGKIALPRFSPVQSPSERPENPVFHEKLYVVGWGRYRNRFNVVLSDGTTVTERNREFERVERNFAVIAGRLFPFKVGAPVERAVEMPSPAPATPTPKTETSSPVLKETASAGLQAAASKVMYQPVPRKREH
jgi:hypothetical protein